MALAEERAGCIQNSQSVDHVLVSLLCRPNGLQAGPIKNPHLLKPPPATLSRHTPRRSCRAAVPLGPSRASYGSAWGPSLGGEAARMGILPRHLVAFRRCPRFADVASVPCKALPLHGPSRKIGVPPVALKCPVWRRLAKARRGVGPAPLRKVVKPFFFFAFFPTVLTR